MLARSRTVSHPMGVGLRTPAFVPSFSSKGFGFKSGGQSEIVDALQTAKEWLTDTLLVSAYDIYHGHLGEEYLSICEIVFVDSGGYETNEEHDLSAVYRHPYKAKKWSLDALRSVYQQWPEGIPAVFVSFDHPSERRPIGDQISAAEDLFKEYPDQLHNIILKPETAKQKYLQVDSVIESVERLSTFHIVGVTEKELGDSLLKRLENIARIRMALDNAQINAPIHVFGSLDPLTATLFFVAGAEIFDGLTWLRYSYLDGTAIYPYNYGAVRIGINVRDSLIKARTLVDNVSCLQKLQYDLIAYSRDGDFSKLKNHAAVVSDAYNTLCGRLGGVI